MKFIVTYTSACKYPNTLTRQQRNVVRKNVKLKIVSIFILINIFYEGGGGVQKTSIVKQYCNASIVKQFYNARIVKQHCNERFVKQYCNTRFLKPYFNAMFLKQFCN